MQWSFFSPQHTYLVLLHEWFHRQAFQLESVLCKPWVNKKVSVHLRRYASQISASPASKEVSQTSRTIRNNKTKHNKKAQRNWLGRKRSLTSNSFFSLFFHRLRQKRGLQLRHCRLHRLRRWRGEGGKTHITTCTSKREPNKSQKSSDRSSLERQRRTKPNKLGGLVLFRLARQNLEKNIRVGRQRKAGSRCAPLQTPKKSPLACYKGRVQKSEA